ncbi:MAG TPA: GGDEF domain-containing protein, partial [Clostridiales bacterium]|nr:GGDEF domain-containing protein [Clostridiales bacterium]
AQELSCELDLDGVKGRVLEAARRLAPSDIAVLVLWDDLDRVLRCSAAVPEGSRVEGKCCRLGEGVIGRVAERKVVEVVDRPDGDRTDDGLGDLEARSLVVVPLTAEGNLVGVLVLGADEAGRYTEEHVRLLTIFAGQAGAALSRAVRYQETCQMAITDSRTGVYNYRFFYERLVDEMRRHRSKNKPLSVIFLDLDHLKDINDQFGHQVGDEVLAQVASLIAANVRETDEVARYGGEEFVVLLPGATGEMSVAVAERIRGAVEGHDFATRFDLEPVRVTVTAGVATYPEHATEPEELILRADEAMYQGKRRGRNRVSLYTPVETACEPGQA